MHKNMYISSIHNVSIIKEVSVQSAKTRHDGGLSLRIVASLDSASVRMSSLGSFMLLGRVLDDVRRINCSGGEARSVTLSVTAIKETL